jgi:hypothetical protein
MASCLTSPSRKSARATAIVCSLSSVVSPMRHSYLLQRVAWDDVTWQAVEPRYPSGIPPLNIGPRQCLRLLANSIAGCESLEAADYAFLISHRDSEAFQVCHA